MKRKLISLAVALMLVLQVAALPLIAMAEVTALPYFANSDFTDVAAAADLPLRIDGNPWLYKGSAATHAEVLKQDADGSYYANFTSDSVKEGKAGEGSWYFYYRNQKNPISEKGFVKFDIRVNSGNFQFQAGSYTDPTKGADPCAITVTFDAAAKTITATSANNKINEIVNGLKTGEWYTVLIEINNPTQEYTVTVTDKDKKEYKTEALSYVQSTSEAPFIFVFAYIRKFNGHDFDLTKYSIAKGEYSEAALAATPTPAPTEAPTEAPVATATPVATEKPVNFTDISSHWAKDDVVSMYQAGIIDGISSTKFAPDDKITRSQFIKLVVATLGLDTKAAYTGACTDVKDHWSAQYVQAAETAKLIDSNLVADNKLLPDQNITREEMAALITAAAKYKGVDYAGGSVDSFTDKADISAWATEYVAGAVKLEIVKGMEDGSFAPKADATRAQSAVMISRLLAKVK